MNISKAEAARQLNISAMTYGRYEKENANPLIRQYLILLRFFIAILTFYMELQMS